MEPTATTTKKKRSETRQRQSMLSMRLLPHEHEHLRSEAARRGMSVSELARNLVLGRQPAH